MPSLPPRSGPRQLGGYCDGMTPEDETSPDGTTAAPEDAAAPADETTELTEEEIQAEPVDTEPLERAEDAIDEAREAAAKASAADAIDSPRGD